MPEMIKRDRLLVALGAFAPLGSRTNQANVPLQRVPQLRQFIETKLSQPAAHTCHSAIALARIHVIVYLIPAQAHCPKFHKNEALAIATDPFLPEQDRS